MLEMMKQVFKNRDRLVKVSLLLETMLTKSQDCSVNKIIFYMSIILLKAYIYSDI